MLQPLTDYLIRNKYVIIPSVGGFRIRQQPAVLDFANRVIHPHHFHVEHFESAAIHPEQITYLANIYRRKESEMDSDLQEFGKQLQNNIRQSVFKWNGIGTLEYRNGHIMFISAIQSPLMPVPAHKVIHENAAHTILRGERELSSDEAVYPFEFQKNRSLLKIILWVVAALLLLLVILHFVQNGFNITSTGSGTKLLSYITN